ncbi:MAG: hypothetical protein JXB18_13120, partial [Sedimentisphaerales bacterium]|nr:hypothetical protein [Sedimentisphaerales bacterium]
GSVLRVWDTINGKCLWQKVFNDPKLSAVGGKLAAGLGSNATIETNIANVLIDQPIHLALTVSNLPLNNAVDAIVNSMCAGRSTEDDIILMGICI